jgi:hypothetical protein
MAKGRNILPPFLASKSTTPVPMDATRSKSERSKKVPCGLDATAVSFMSQALARAAILGPT